MKFASLGSDTEALAMARAVAASADHEMVHICQAGDSAAQLRRLAPQAQISEDWESLLDARAVQAPETLGTLVVLFALTLATDAEPVDALKLRTTMDCLRRRRSPLTCIGPALSHHRRHLRLTDQQRNRPES